MTDNKSLDIDRKRIQVAVANVFEAHGVNSETIAVAICNAIEEYHKQQQQRKVTPEWQSI